MRGIEHAAVQLERLVLIVNAGGRVEDAVADLAAVDIELAPPQPRHVHPGSGDLACNVELLSHQGRRRDDNGALEFAVMALDPVSRVAVQRPMTDQPAADIVALH